MNTLIRKIFKPRDTQSLKEAIEDLIEDHDDDTSENGDVSIMKVMREP